MAKRFTDTSKYKKPFYRRLPGAYKLFYDFLYHDCDHAGVWIVDIETAQNYVGKDMIIKEDLALDNFNKDEARIIPFDSGKKWFIPLFIYFQYGQLSEKNRAHSAVIQILKKYNLIDEKLCPITNIPKPLTAPLQGAKDMDMDKDKEMEQEEGGMGETFLAPQMVQVFKENYPAYPIDEDKDYPSCFQIATKIAKIKGWTKESITNGKLTETLLAWRAIVVFSKSDDWYSTRAIPDFNKEFQRLIQKMTNGTISKRTFGEKPIPSGNVPEGGFGKL